MGPCRRRLSRRHARVRNQHRPRLRPSRQGAPLCCLHLPLPDRRGVLQVRGGGQLGIGALNFPSAASCWAWHPSGYEHAAVAVKAGLPSSWQLAGYWVPGTHTVASKPWTAIPAHPAPPSSPPQPPGAPLCRAPPSRPPFLPPPACPLPQHRRNGKRTTGGRQTPPAARLGCRPSEPTPRRGRRLDQVPGAGLWRHQRLCQHAGGGAGGGRRKGGGKTVAARQGSACMGCPSAISGALHVRPAAQHAPCTPHGATCGQHFGG